MRHLIERLETLAEVSITVPKGSVRREGTAVEKKIRDKIVQALGDKPGTGSSHWNHGEFHYKGDQFRVVPLAGREFKIERKNGEFVGNASSAKAGALLVRRSRRP